MAHAAVASSWKTVWGLHRHRRKMAALARAGGDGAAVLDYQDTWIRKVLSLPHTPALGEAAKAAKVELQNARVPTTRMEEYRFTDLSSLVNSNVTASVSSTSMAKPLSLVNQVERNTLSDAKGSMVVVIDGQIDADMSDLSSLPEGVYVGPLSGAPSQLQEAAGALTREYGGTFAKMNLATAEDCSVIHVPAGCYVAQPVHVLYLSLGGAKDEACYSAPRLLVSAEKDSALQLIEEFVPAHDAGGAYVVNAVAEVHVQTGASVDHKYVGLDGEDASHMRTTVVMQAERSHYSLTEVTLGGCLSRHDLHVQQGGPDTETDTRHFVLCGKGQLHDLHSKLRLAHPRGKSECLHKCIVAHADGRGVFDGNVRVDKLAQKTDASQLSRNLLLTPRATVNVKPNLQIVADDVKCSHGCTVSDLEDDQVFYFLSRGIDKETARAALVYSFGMEVVGRIQQEDLRKRLEAATRASLARAAQA